LKEYLVTEFVKVKRRKHERIVYNYARRPRENDIIPKIPHTF
jgi:hypothetical protein